MKVCTGCRQAKDSNEFYRNKNSKDGLTHTCAECGKAAAHRWKKANPISTRSKRGKHIKSRYGITLHDYDTMLVAQRGCCALCEQRMDRPNVDHCHTTGEVRGLLCHLCNRGLGLFKDSPAVLIRAAEYV